MTAADDWPRTGRALPWLLALFLVVLWFIPSEAIEVSLPLPISPYPDRFLLIAIGLLALASAFVNRGFAPSRPAGWFLRILALFAVVALASVVLNAETLVSLGEIDQATKQLSLLVCNLVLFLAVATTIRPSEVRNFAVLMVVLAGIAAAGTIWEYRTDYNVFYDVAKKLFGGVASVAPVPGTTPDGREDTFGPTQHGLAMTTMLSMALGFAVLGLIAARTPARKLLYALAVALIVAAGVATLRKTSLVAPAAALLVLVAYRPRQMLRLAPLGAVLLVIIHLLAPGALGGVGTQITGGFFDAGTTVGRTSDYQAVTPDIASYPLLGRGWGTMNPLARSDTYRILDNHYLGTLIQVGFVGLAFYVALLLAALLLAHGVARRGFDAERRSIGLAAAAGFGAFAVAGALFDLFSFWEVPYLFVFIAGLCSVAATRPAGDPPPRSVPDRTPSLDPVPAA